MSVCCSDHAAHIRRWRAERRDIALASARAARKSYNQRNPEKHRAWNAVYRATRRGDLVRPETCERCGVSGRIEASHDDYGKPLAVEWLCRSCHRIKDRLEGSER